MRAPKNPFGSRGPLKVEPYLMTPEEARDILDHRNNYNRAFKESALEAVHQSVLMNGWQPYDTVKIDPTGELLDGAHRLEEIARSGQPQWILLVRGVPREHHSMFDTHSSRSAADNIGIEFREAQPYRTDCAALGRIIWSEETLGTASLKVQKHPGPGRSHLVVDAFLKDPERYLGWIKEAQRWKLAVGGRSPIAFSLIRIEDTEGSDAARQFSQEVAEFRIEHPRIDLPTIKEMPGTIARMRERTMLWGDRRTSKSGSRLVSVYELSGLVVLSYNYWKAERAGSESPEAIKFGQSNRFPTPGEVE